MVTVTRVGAQSTYPTQFILICAMNVVRSIFIQSAPVIAA